MNKVISWAFIALLFGGIAIAADNIGVTAGSGKNIACKEISAVCYVQHILVNSSGTEIGTTTTPIIVGSNLWSVKPTIASYTATTYTSGQTIGAKGTLTIPTVGSGGAVLITFADMKDMAGTVGQPINANVDLILFDADPSGSTFTNAASYAIVAADAPKVIGRITLQCGVIGIAGSAVNTTGIGECSAANLSNPIALASGTTVYWVLISDGQRTQLSTSDLYLYIAGTL